MIDLHCHILPGIDDGAADLGISLQMARALVADGVSVVACTPHILPGLYHNTGPQIRAAAAELQRRLDEEAIPLRVVTGADNHLVPDFAAAIGCGHLLTLADSRYVLVEPPHHVAPARIEDFFFNLLVAGYVPILTHPERLSWIKTHYKLFQRLAQGGVWMQITAGSLVGDFGAKAKYWAERMLDEGYVHILATDAHDVERRPPNLSAGYECAAMRLGAEAARDLVISRPRGVIENVSPAILPMPPAGAESAGTSDHGIADDRGLSRARHSGSGGGGVVGWLWRHSQ